MASLNKGHTRVHGIGSDTELQLKKLQLVDVSKTGKVIGKGSYGQVIEVFVHGTLCAAKEIHPVLITHDDADRVKRSFQIECVNSSQIFHPNVVQVLGIYYPTPRPKLPWLVMELMETSLKGLIDTRGKKGIPLHFKLSILVDVAHGLEFLHTKDIVHRDLSSNNILLTKQLVAKIADLGMAKVIEQNKMMTLTQTPGTLHFMPPEALANRPRYGPPVDVFSLACVVLHLMSCKWPEPKDRVVEVEDSLIALTEVQRRDEYLQSHFSSIPTLRSLVTACLHNKPEQRPKISEICTAFQELKSNIDKQIPFAIANSIELFEEVCRGHRHIQGIETALKNAESSLAKEKSLVSTLEVTNGAQVRQLQQYKNLLEAEKAKVAQLEVVIKEMNQQLHHAKLQAQSNKIGDFQPQILEAMLWTEGIPRISEHKLHSLLEIDALRNFDTLCKPCQIPNMRVYLVSPIDVEESDSEVIDFHYFVRTVAPQPEKELVTDATPQIFEIQAEVMFQKALHQLAQAFHSQSSPSTSNNHVFLNLLAVFTLEPMEMQKMVCHRVTSCQSRLRELRVKEIEIKALIKLKYNPEKCIRIFITPNGDAESYYEDYSIVTRKVVFKTFGAKKGSYDGLPVDEPYFRPRYRTEMVKPFRPPIAVYKSPCNAVNKSPPNAVYKSSVPDYMIENWQCSVCTQLNEVSQNVCRSCKKKRGEMAASDYYCDFCRIQIFIPKLRFDTISCPRCKIIVP